MRTYVNRPTLWRRMPHGFTLIELLIAVAIISLLGAVILAVFGRVRETSRRTQCASNLKQIGLAIQMYASDYNRYLPCVDYSSVGQSPQCAWAERIFIYTRQKSVFECPARDDYEFEPGCPPDSTTIDEDGFPYNFDGGYDMNRLTRAGYRYVLESSLTHPTDTISILDGKGRVITPGFNPIPDLATLHTQVKRVRHGNGYNVLFVDGHVRWMPETALLEERLWWPKDQRPY